jgi:ATP-dependent DNA helicase RecG
MTHPEDPLQTPIQFVKGVGPFIGELLAKKGIQTVFDLFYYFPIRYLDRRKLETIRQLTPGKSKCLVATVVGGASRPLGKTRRRVFEMVVNDSTGIALLTWFHYNEAFLKKKGRSDMELW